MKIRFKGQIYITKVLNDIITVPIQLIHLKNKNPYLISTLYSNLLMNDI